MEETATTVTRQRDTPQRAHTVAARMFATKGYDATTTRELSAALGVTNGTFYHHFASKQQLLFSICSGAVVSLSDAVREELQATTDPLSALRKLVGTHVGVVTAARDEHVTMLTEMRSLGGPFRDEVVAARDGYEQLVERVIADACHAGVLRADIPGRRLALFLLNLLNWTIFWFRPDGDATAAQLADEMLEVFLHGAVKREGLRCATT